MPRRIRISITNLPDQLTASSDEMSSMESRQELFSETRYTTTLFLFEYAKVQLCRPDESVENSPSIPKIQDRFDAIENELFIPYSKGLKHQAANKNNPLPSNNSFTPEPIEDLLLLKLLSLESLIKDDRVLRQRLHKLLVSLKSDIRVMRNCVDCIKLWYLHETPGKDSFATPCNRPHLLVWVKRDNYFWPAKFIEIRAHKALISLFGATRCNELVLLDDILLLTEDYPRSSHLTSLRKASYRTLQKEFQQAMTQLQAHIDLLNSQYADSPLLIYHEIEEMLNVREYISAFGKYLVKEKLITRPYATAKKLEPIAPASPPSPCTDPEVLYNKLMEEGSISIHHVETLLKHPKMQMSVEIDLYDSNGIIIKSEPHNRRNELDNSSSTSVESNSFTFWRPQVEATRHSVNNCEPVRDRSPVSDSCEISSTEADFIEHSGHQIYSDEEPSDVNVSASSVSHSSDTSLDFESDQSSRDKKSRDDEVTFKIPLKKHLKRLRKELDRDYTESCSHFDVNQHTIVKFAKQQYEKELAHAKRTTWCSVCKSKPANIHLSLASANSNQWHPYNNNYAYCSSSCKSKR